MSLKVQTFKGVKWTTSASLLASFLQLAQLGILARIFNATEFGFIALLTVVSGFAQAFADMGVSNAIIQKPYLSMVQLNTLYWLNIFSGLAVFLVVFFSASIIAEFYQYPELTYYIQLTAIGLFIQPFGQQFLVLLQKELKFDELAKIDIVTKVMAFIVTLTMAFMGYGIISVVIGGLLGILLQTLFLMYRGVKTYPVKLIFQLTEVKDFIRFGLYQMGEKILNYFHGQIDSLLIGKLLGMEALGIYNIAKQIIMKPAQIINPILTKVTFPVMAKVQEDTEKLKMVYLKSINYLSSVNFPIYALIFFTIPEIVAWFLGGDWLEVIPLVHILCIYGALRSIGNPVGSLLLAKGRADWGFYWNLVIVVYISLCIFIASRWGLVGIAWSWVFIMASVTLPMWFFLVRPLCRASFSEYFLQITKPLSVTLLASVPIVILLYTMGEHLSSVVRVSLIGVIGFVFYVGISVLINKEFMQDMKQFIVRQP
ncbi:MAG: MOP flippase family protein [Moraxella sp.]|nr:MOP flippase family protein [Moraxella sp.]